MLLVTGWAFKHSRISFLHLIHVFACKQCEEETITLHVDGVVHAEDGEMQHASRIHGHQNEGTRQKQMHVREVQEDWELGRAHNERQSWGDIATNETGESLRSAVKHCAQADCEDPGDTGRLNAPAQSSAFSTESVTQGQALENDLRLRLTAKLKGLAASSPFSTPSDAQQQSPQNDLRLCLAGKKNGPAQSRGLSTQCNTEGQALENDLRLILMKRRRKDNDWLFTLPPPHDTHEGSACRRLVVALLRVLLCVSHY